MQSRIAKINDLLTTPVLRHNIVTLLSAIAMSALLYACTSAAGTGVAGETAPSLPVITLNAQPATTFREFTASLEGSKDIEIRPQVDGILEDIYVDEGAAVKKGQSLFRINDRPYREQLNNAQASLAAARANLLNAEINVNKLTPLVQANVVSDVQLKTAQASYSAAAASVAQAQAMVNNASINLGYTLIKAPSDGYIGRIPSKIGSLVGSSNINALTVLSSVKEVYTYFSFSEKDFLLFSNEFAGKSLAEKIKQIPAVEFVLADNTIYPLKGRVETISGQFNNGIGAISLRAVFQNPDGLLRSGNTGRIRIPYTIDTAMVIPQEATFDLQDKTFVFVVSDSNKVSSTPIAIAARSGNYYLVKKGLSKGQKIVYTGLDRLKDGTIIQPEQLSMDSLLRSRPM